MHAEKLLVHDGRQGETVERLHARIVHCLCIFDLACVCVCVCVGGGGGGGGGGVTK